MTDNTSFFNMVNASPVLTQRWVKVAGEVVTAARDMFGVHLDHEDVGSIMAARAATLGAHDLSDYMAELSALQKVRDRVPAKATTKHEPAPKADSGVPQHAMGAGDDAYARAEERAAMRRFADIRAGRIAVPATPEKTDPANLSDVEKIRYLMTVTDRSRRMALARSWNLTGL